MSGNLFEDRNWLLPPNYLNNGNENKTENEPKITTGITSPRPPIKEEEPKTNDQSTENAVGDQVALFVNLRRRKRNKTRYNSKRCHPDQSYKNHRPEDPRP